MKEGPIMTGLGATIYGGFFGLAALWLFLTAERADQPNEPVRSNSIKQADALVGSSPWSASHSSEK